MQRWFFANEAETCHTMPDPGPTSSPSRTSSPSSSVSERPWTFRLLMNIELELYPNERVAVVGNCHALGDWLSSNCVVMTREEGRNIWSTSVSIPSSRPVDYRYLICAIDPATEQIIVRRWETHLRPRSIPAAAAAAATEPVPGLDMFGVVDLEEKMDRGWLTTETIVQLKFLHSPFTWQKPGMNERRILVKITPMNLRIPDACDNHSNNANPAPTTLDEPQMEAAEGSSTAFAFNEVATLNDDDCEIRPQPEFGTRCSGQDNVVVFHLTIGDFESTAYQVDLFTYSSKAVPDDEPPYHLGYGSVLPSLIRRSEGALKVPVRCAATHRPLGMMQIRYLIVRPLTTSLWQDMQVSYSRYWNPQRPCLDVGHRGSGKNPSGCSSAGGGGDPPENTIASFKNAAEHGVDMVEFDVQLSKDLVPVVYHGFRIHGGPLKSRLVCELTLDQLRSLHFERCGDDPDEGPPAIAQLAEVLEAIDGDVGFNVEVKWPQRHQDHTLEENFDPAIDRNSYVDCILDVILRLGGKRRIVLSCFDADLCTMLRFKQNRYPTMFLVHGAATRPKKYLDPRTWSIERAMFHALAMELLGLVAHADDLLRDPFQIHMVKNRDLVLFCWGGDHNTVQTINVLKHLGLNGIIYDIINLRYREQQD